MNAQPLPIEQPENQKPTTQQTAGERLETLSTPRAKSPYKRRRNEPRGTFGAKPIDREILKEQLIKYRGNMTKVAFAMHCARQSIALIARTDPEIKKVLDEARERCVDDVENAFIDKCIAGRDTTAQIFFLKTRGRDRGYDQDYRLDIEAITRSALDFALNRSRNPVSNSRAVLEDKPIDV